MDFASVVKNNNEKLNEDEVPQLELVEVPKALGDLIEAIIGNNDANLS